MSPRAPPFGSCPGHPGYLTTRTAARLLEALQVHDLAIQEPEVEEVVRSLFSGNIRDNDG